MQVRFKNSLSHLIGMKGLLVIIRATKSQYSQNFSAFLKVYETSSNKISRSYHEGILS